MTAAIYAARASMKPLVFAGAQPGGLLTTTSDVENFPGFPAGINGFDLLWRMREQAQKFGAKIENGSVKSVDFSGEIKKVFTEDGLEFQAKRVIIATGAKPRMCGFPPNCSAGTSTSAAKLLPLKLRLWRKR